MRRQRLPSAPSRRAPPPMAVLRRIARRGRARRRAARLRAWRAAPRCARLGNLPAALFLHIEDVRRALAVGVDVRADDGYLRLGEHVRELRQQARPVAAGRFDHGRVRRDVVVDAHPGLDREGGGAARRRAAARGSGVILQRGALQARDQRVERVADRRGRTACDRRSGSRTRRTPRRRWSCARARRRCRRRWRRSPRRGWRTGPADRRHRPALR